MKWNAPELVILGRGNMQESVLEHCKDPNTSDTGNPACAGGGVGTPCLSESLS